MEKSKIPKECSKVHVRLSFLIRDFLQPKRYNITDKSLYNLVSQTSCFVLSNATRDRTDGGDGLSVIGRGRHVATASGPVDVNVFASLELGVLFSGEDTEGVGTEVVTLSLEDIGRNDLAPVTVQEGKSCREGRGGNTPENGLSDDAPPTWLSLVDGYERGVRSNLTHWCWRHTLDKEVIEEE